MSARGPVATAFVTGLLVPSPIKAIAGAAWAVVELGFALYDRLSGRDVDREIREHADRYRKTYLYE